MHTRRAGRAALLIDCADGAEVEAWRAELWRRRERGELAAVEIVPGARTLLLDGLADPEETAGLVAGWAPPPPASTAPGPLRKIPVRYDGVDLAAVASEWRVPVREAVERIAGTELRVAFCGFAPGFAYLTGLPWPVRRLDTPRPRVPAGSVALAGEYAGIYPTASPGGWRLIGSTDALLFDIDRDPPALLAPGTRVRLVAA
ncbi:carboxyltransferase domain-containing protein [Phytohabitans sp. ZYX-F-186]|uniref:Carboxyltransferase domain-containing protein n=1 Tax=Phytohabitans maris TaxID=3071409 RepID=A0ABU0ZWG0_9ACTN|nr:carboxyltransferase domain-containing protein [Phytohabitans sp. ZYX-F-186]MDQ7910297.1 carboxyltransferase domain-containing protein [Phytohabitans sp. ZYX-F-186]